MAMADRSQRLSFAAAMFAASALLASCGGSGGGPVVNPPAPTPTPTPTPAPTPTPTPTASFSQIAVPAALDTQEMGRSEGPGQHNAHVAWEQGHTGDGVTIAVIDTGIDVDSPEFAGRLLPQSADIYASRDALDASDDHGTNVAMVAAAAQDNTGVLGIAWDADVLAIRVDEPGTCLSDNPATPSTDCVFLDSDIAKGVDYAVANGAKVINISLGGAGGANVQLEQSVAAATAAGALVVVAAGNDGFGQLENFGSELIAVGNGAVLVVGSVDENYQISNFSNKPGAQTDFFIAARGETICCTYEDGELFVDNEGFFYFFSGTSFATPQVSGAAALLAQAFPNLTGAEIADILLRTAFDAGATGDDAVFGRGILDINAAFQPLGTTSIAGSASAYSLTSISGTASPAMGDALSSQSLQSVITDEFGRAYHAALGTGLIAAQQQTMLHGALAGQQRHVAAGNSRNSLAFSIDDRGRTETLRLQYGQAEQARVLAAKVALQLAQETQLGFAYAQGSEGLVAQLQGHERPAFMIAGPAAGDNGLLQGHDASIALRQKLGGWGLTVSASSGKTFAGAVERRVAELRGNRLQEDLATFGFALDRRIGDLDTNLGVSWMAEDATMLGAHFQSGLGLKGADSLFLDMEAGWNFAQGWRLGGSLRQGWTQARLGGFVVKGSHISSRAFSVDLQRLNLFAPGDALAVRISQPLRVEGGHLALLLPQSWDYETLSAQYGLQSIALAPQGRELDAELAWRGWLFGGKATASLFWRKEPGHIVRANDDAGVALRWSRAF